MGIFGEVREGGVLPNFKFMWEDSKKKGRVLPKNLMSVITCLNQTYVLRYEYHVGERRFKGKRG